MRRRDAVSRGVLAPVVGVAGVVPLGAIASLAPYPAYWAWLASSVLPVAGGCLASREGSGPKGDPELERRRRRAFDEEP